MNSTSQRYESLGDAARHALQDVKQATTDGARDIAHTAQAGCHAMAQSTLNDVQRLESWAADRPLRSVALTFAAGVLIGMVLFRR